MSVLSKYPVDIVLMGGLMPVSQTVDATTKVADPNEQSSKD